MGCPVPYVRKNFSKSIEMFVCLFNNFLTKLCLCMGFYKFFPLSISLSLSIYTVGSCSTLAVVVVVVVVIHSSSTLSQTLPVSVYLHTHTVSRHNRLCVACVLFYQLLYQWPSMCILSYTSQYTEHNNIWINDLLVDICLLFAAVFLFVSATTSVYFFSIYIYIQCECRFGNAELLYSPALVSSCN